MARQDGESDTSTVSVRILLADKKKVSEQAVGKEPFPYVLHRVIEKALGP